MPDERKPFHESILPAIDRATRSGKTAFEVLAPLIRETAIPKNHDAIIEAWLQGIRELGMGNDLAVPGSVLAQKEALEDTVA